MEGRKSSQLDNGFVPTPIEVPPSVPLLFDGLSKLLLSAEWLEAKAEWPEALTPAVQDEITLNLFKMGILLSVVHSDKLNGLVNDGLTQLAELYAPFFLCNDLTVFETGYDQVAANGKTFNKGNLLQLCAFQGSEEVFTKLCALMNIEIGSAEYVELISKPDLNTLFIASPLHIAAYSNNVRLLRFLHQSTGAKKHDDYIYADIELEHYSFMHFAAMGGAVEAMEYCLKEFGLTLSANISPFSLTAFSNNVAAIKQIFAWGYSPSEIDFILFNNFFNEMKDVRMCARIYMPIIPAQIDLISALELLPEYKAIQEKRLADIEERRVEKEKADKVLEVCVTINKIRDNFTNAISDLSAMQIGQTIDMDALSILVKEMLEDANKQLSSYEEAAKSDSNIDELLSWTMSAIKHKAETATITPTSQTSISASLVASQSRPVRRSPWSDAYSNDESLVERQSLASQILTLSGDEENEKKSDAKEKTEKVLEVRVAIKKVSDDFISAITDLSITIAGQSIDRDVLTLLVMEMVEEANRQLSSYEEVAKRDSSISEMLSRTSASIRLKAESVTSSAALQTRFPTPDAPPSSPERKSRWSGEFSRFDSSVERNSPPPRMLSSSSSATMFAPPSLPPYSPSLPGLSAPPRIDGIYSGGSTDNLSSRSSTSIYTSNPQPVRRRIDFDSVATKGALHSGEGSPIISSSNRWTHPDIELEDEKAEKRSEDEKEEKKIDSKVLDFGFKRR